jgi:hypothetical protein
LPNLKSDDNSRFRELLLERRWPGEDRPSPYLRFRFPQVIHGPVRVWYNDVKHRFVMQDENGSSADVMGEEIVRAVYRVPIQSGTL